LGENLNIALIVQSTLVHSRLVGSRIAVAPAEEEDPPVDFPSSPSPSAIAPTKFDLSSQPSALGALRDRYSILGDRAREDDICQKCRIGSEGQRDMVYGGGFDMVETVSFLHYVSSSRLFLLDLQRFQLKQSDIFVKTLTDKSATLLSTLERGEDRKDPPSRSYERLTFESTTTIRLAMSIVRYTVRYYSMTHNYFYEEWYNYILLTQAEHKSQVAQSLEASPRKSDVGLRVARRGARDLRSRIDLGLEIEDINQRSATLVHVGGRYADANRNGSFSAVCCVYPCCAR
ncbi:hypothetical protein ALC57_07392, partial [Trachymyrmex cornetzi]